MTDVQEQEKIFEGGASQGSRGTLHRTVIRACRACNAPGIYQSTRNPGFKDWPGIQVEPTDPRHDKPVGDVCPNCGAERPEPEVLEPIRIER